MSTGKIKTFSDASKSKVVILESGNKKKFDFFFQLQLIKRNFYIYFISIEKLHD